MMIGDVRFVGEMKSGGVKNSPDFALDNADWAKSGSDFAFAKDVEGMRKYLTEQGIDVEHFKTLPIYQRGKDKYPWFQGL
jgi:hypothetical protein